MSHTPPITNNPYQEGGNRYWAKVHHTEVGIAIVIFDGQVSADEPILFIAANMFAWEQIVKLMKNPPSFAYAFLLPVTTWADWKQWQRTGEEPLAYEIDRHMEHGETP